MKNKFLKVLLAMIFALCFFAFAGPSCRAEAAEGKGSANMIDNKNAGYTEDLYIKGAEGPWYNYDNNSYVCYYYLAPGQKLKLSDKIYYKGNQVSFSQVKVNKVAVKYTNISSDSTVIAAKTSGSDNNTIWDFYEIVYKTYKVDLWIYVMKPYEIKAVEDVPSGMKISWTCSQKLDKSDGVYIYRSINGGAYTKVKKVYFSSKSWTDTDATKVGAKYSYKIKTFVTGSSIHEEKDVYFISDYSAAKTCTRTGTPKISQVVNFSKGPCVKWERVKGVSGYYIYRRIGDGSYEKVKTITDPTVVQWTDTKATKNNQKYVYKMYAYTNFSGKTVKSAVSNVGVIYRLSRPSITKVDDSTISWTANSAATEYEVLLDDKTYGIQKTYHIQKGETSFNNWEVFKENFPDYAERDEYERQWVEVSVRTVKTVNGVKYYSQYSSVVKIYGYYIG